MGARYNYYFRKLLVGFDDSPQSKKAVDVAMDLAECMDAKLLAFSVFMSNPRSLALPTSISSAAE